MPYAQVNGQRLWYDDTKGGGTPLLFCHGFMMTGEMFEAQVALLRDNYRCITWDERVRALVLIDTEAGDETPENLVALQAMFGDWSVHGPANYGKTAAGLLLADPDLERHWMTKWEQVPPRRVVEPSRAVMERDSVLGRLPDVTCPVMVIHGSADEAIPISHARQMADQLPSCLRFVEVAGGRHAANMTHPEVVNPEIIAFLGSI